jgi:hypothetical protein
MTEKERSERIELPVEEVLHVITSIQDLVLLADHYKNPPETKDFLVQMSICTTKLEAIVHRMKENIAE